MNQTPHLLFSPDSPNKRRNWQPERVTGGDGGDNKPSTAWANVHLTQLPEPYTLTIKTSQAPFSTNLDFVFIFTLISWD